MTERLLQFIWQFQYYNRNELTTASGEQLQVIFPGQSNIHQGPDFSDAKIKVNNTLWAGSIELHLKTSDWKKHRHDLDGNYDNVVLHVVWQHDNVVNNTPVLELASRVSKHLLAKYEELMNSSDFIPCENIIHSVKEITWKSWKERLLAERLIRKSKLVESYLQQTNNHWEETFWWLLCRNFGIKVNADAFEAIARSVPVNILAKHKSQIHQLEALLLGQAGLLDATFEEEYPKLLQREYQFLKKKHQLQLVHQPVHFLRMRPGNFPTIRLAQLAMLVHSSAHLFSRIKEADSIYNVKEWFNITANDYWHYHYSFGEPSSFSKKQLGTSMIENIIVNTVVPMLFAYGNLHAEQSYKDKAIQWLEQLKPEKNSITQGFAALKIENKNAFDSQALIELKNEYCNKKRCLECTIGNSLLKQ